MKNAIPLSVGQIRRVPSLVLFLIMFVLPRFSPCLAGEFHNSLSLQGYTGLLNTPNAEVTDEGKLYALFSNQQERQWRNRTNRQENYMFSVGLFSIIELGGRVTDAPNVVTDLSGNFKLKVPFIPKGYYLPSIALGIQDFGGAARNLQTAYVVASEELWRFRLSIGYGTGPDRMKGVFGGAEFKAFDWLYLVGENDTRETNVGIRLITPYIFGVPINLNVTAKTSLSYRPGSVIEFGFGLQFPLGFDHFNTKRLAEKPRVAERQPEEKPEVAAEEEIASVRKYETVTMPAKEDKDNDAALLDMKKRLVEAGFQNVAVGSKDSLLVVQYEDSRFNQNAMDGIGVVAGIAVEYAPPDLTELRLIIRKKGIRTLQLSMPVKALGEFLRNADKLAKFDDSLRITTHVEEDGQVRYVQGDSNPSWLKSSLMIYPGLQTFIATEVGVFDYQLSIEPDLYINTWKGSVLNARWDIPVSWSKNFDNGKPFRRFRDNNQFDRLMLFQTVRITPTVMANLGAGMILHDIYGTLNEVMWTPGNGTHRVRVKLGYSEDTSRHTDDQVFLASYRYYFNPLNTYLEATGGKFWDQDKGFTLELKRFFGDTAFSVFYKNSQTADRQHIQVGGVQIAFPLTPRRDMKPYIVQVRGNEDWSYAQETEIVSPGSLNLVGRSIGINPQFPYNLERVFYNRDRFMEAYIRKNLLRLRDANIRYNHKAVLNSPESRK
jgi:hypothetical protein